MELLQMAAFSSHFFSIMAIFFSILVSGLTCDISTTLFNMRETIHLSTKPRKSSFGIAWGPNILVAFVYYGTPLNPIEKVHSGDIMS